MIRSFWSIGTTLAITLFLSDLARAQVIPINNNQNQVAGVYVDADGTVRARQQDNTADLAAQRLRAKAQNQPPKDSLAYVSLPRLIAEVQNAAQNGQELPDDLRYLSGLTQIRYVFVFPEEKDLVIAGPAEPIDATVKSQPIGKLTGRPVLQLDDLVVALRIAQTTRGPKAIQAFGCSIDPPADCMEKSGKVMRDFAAATRAQRMAAMKDAIGPQKVMLFGAPDDSRIALVALAADYRLKRMCLALEPVPAAGVGSAIDNSRAASNRFWFEASYAPLLVSPAGDAYEIRGQRLMVKCGAFSFDERGATETAKAFAKRFTEKMPRIAAMIPAYAELQNVSDLALLAALIRHDRLDSRAGLNLSQFTAAYKPTSYIVPRLAETLVNFTSGSIVAGGVSMNLSSLMDDREQDKSDKLKSSRARPADKQWVLRQN